MNEGRSAFLAGPCDLGKQNSRSWLLVSSPLPVTCPRVSGPSRDISDKWMRLIIIFPHHKPLPKALMLEEQRCWKREWRWTGRVQREAQMAGWHLLTRDVLNMSQLHRHKLRVIYNVLVAWLCPTLCDPMDYIACQAPLFMELSRQESWSGLPFPFPGDLPDPRIEPGLLHYRQILYYLSYREIPM